MADADADAGAGTGSPPSPPLKRYRFDFYVEDDHTESGVDPDDASAHGTSAVRVVAAADAPAVLSWSRKGDRPFGALVCDACENRILEVRDAAPALGWRVDDVCFTCQTPGHWKEFCPKRPAGAMDILFSANLTRFMQDEVLPVGELRLDVLCAAEIAHKPVEFFLDPLFKLHQHTLAAEVLPRMPFPVMDRLFYERAKPLQGLLTTELHSICMHRFYLSVAHALHKGDEKNLVELPLWNVFEDAHLLFKPGCRRKGQFERNAKFFFDTERPARMVATKEMALRNFARVTRGLVTPEMLQKHNGITVAGGSVVAALTMCPTTDLADTEFEKSDVDIFVHDAVNPRCVAYAVVRDLIETYKQVRTSPEGRWLIANSRGDNSRVLQCFFEGGFPLVQVIMPQKHITTSARLLATFDNDCSAVGFDGEDFFASPPAAHALSRGYNVFDPVQAIRLTYLPRLKKYAERGFPILVPSTLWAKSADANDATSGTADADFEKFALSYQTKPLSRQQGDGYSGKSTPDTWETIEDVERHYGVDGVFSMSFATEPELEKCYCESDVDDAYPITSAQRRGLRHGAITIIVVDNVFRSRAFGYDGRFHACAAEIHSQGRLGNGNIFSRAEWYPPADLKDTDAPRSLLHITPFQYQATESGQPVELQGRELYSSMVFPCMHSLRGALWHYTLLEQKDDLSWEKKPMFA